MSRLIDADWLKSEKVYSHERHEYVVPVYTIDMAKTIDRPQWIPCSERLPEEQKDVLVWYEYFRYGSYNRMFQTYGIARLYGDFWAGDVQGTSAKCIAWMPLPEPYMREGDNN